MKLITATASTQGLRSNDYHWCIEGELVTQAMFICSRDEADPDGGCGCGRGWSGMNSRRGTTTAMVRDLPGFTRDDYLEAVWSSLTQGGWRPEDIGGDQLEDLADNLLAIADSYPVGAILETRLHAVRWRDGGAA